MRRFEIVLMVICVGLAALLFWGHAMRHNLRNEVESLTQTNTELVTEIETLRGNLDSASGIVENQALTIMALQDTLILERRQIFVDTKKWSDYAGFHSSEFNRVADELEAFSRYEPWMEEVDRLLGDIREEFAHVTVGWAEWVRTLGGEPDDRWSAYVYPIQN